MVYEKSLEQQKESTNHLWLMKAVKSGNIAMARRLIAHGGDITERNDTGQTPLHVAALNGDMKMIEELLGQGMDIEAKDNRNMTALYHASKSGLEEVSRFLIQNGAGPSIVERNTRGDCEGMK